MQAVFHSRAGFAADLDALLAVFACGKCVRSFSEASSEAIHVPDATGASRSFCRQDRSRAVSALAFMLSPALASMLWRRDVFFCRQKRVRVEPARFPSLVNLERKIRIVVIVNAGRTVDNRDFFHMLKGLRAVLPVGQTLRLDRIETGQKSGARRTRQFRTFDPVDIQQLIHKARPIRSTSRRCRVANASGVGLFFQERLQEVVRRHGRARRSFRARPLRSKRIPRFTTKSLYTE